MHRAVLGMGALLLVFAPGVSACSFIAESVGGTEVEVHDIRTGQFGFSGPTEFMFSMGNGNSWTSPVYDDGQHPAFRYDYGEPGTYLIEVSCHDVESDAWTDAPPTQITVGGFFGLPYWVWGVVIAAVLVVVVLARARATARAKARRPLQPARARNLSTNTPRRALGCFPAPDHRPAPLPGGLGHTYTATVPAGHAPDLLELEAVWDDHVLHLDWFPPELPPDASLTGYRLFEQRSGGDWHHRDNFPPEVNGLDIDHRGVADGPYRITGYEVRPVFERGAGNPVDARGARITL